MVSFKNLIFNLLVFLASFILFFFYIGGFYLSPQVHAQACYDINKFTSGSGNVYLDQDKSRSSSNQTCAGTGTTTDNVRINVNNLCPDFPDDYSTFPTGCDYTLTTYKVTLDPGYTWSCTAPSGWICGYDNTNTSSVNTSWATSPWTLHWYARPDVNCSISGDTTVCPNTSVSYTKTCTASSPAGYYRSCSAGCAWQSLPDPVSFAAGNYELVVNSGAIGGVACTGNPDCWFNGGTAQCAGYIDCLTGNDTGCSGCDYMVVDVNNSYCATPTPTRTRTPTAAPPTATRTRTPTPTPEGQSITLINLGFEIDADGKVGPDYWTSDSRFTRYSGVKRSGSYSGRIYATDNSSFVIQQKLTGLSAGKTYSYSGYINIPSTGDSFYTALQIKWFNSSASSIRTDEIKRYTGNTGGWVNFTGSKVAPSGTSYAQVRIYNSSLNATIYVDDFNFSAN